MASSPTNKAHTLPISPSSSSLFPFNNNNSNNNNNHHPDSDPQQLDPEQQLRSLLSIVEQYKEHYTQLYEQNKDTIYRCASFQQFINRVKQKSQAEVQALYDGMKSMRKMLQDIFHQFGSVVPEVVKELADWHTKSQKLVDQVSDQCLIIENLKQRQAESQKNLNEITMLYENTRHVNMELNDRINIKQMEYENESKEIRKTFLQVTESNQMQKKILQQMYQSNEKLTSSLLQSKKQKSQLQKQFQLLSDELTKSAHRIHLLQQQLEKKDFKIRECQAEMESIHNSRRKKSTQSMASNGMGSEDDGYNRTSFIEVGEDKKVDKTKLGEQLNGYKMPTIKDLEGSFIMGTGVKRSVDVEDSDYVTEYQQQKAHKSHINASIAEQQQTKMEQCKPSRPKPREVTDPYFSHYILISQSVKIREDCQDMLNIDMKPYYQEIIEKRVPMHLWDQWVKNRLRELMRQNYPVE